MLKCQCPTPRDPVARSHSVTSAKSLHHCELCENLVCAVRPEMPIRLAHERLQRLGVLDWRVSCHTGTTIAQLKTLDRHVTGMGDGVTSALNEALRKL